MPARLCVGAILHAADRPAHERHDRRRADRSTSRSRGTRRRRSRRTGTPTGRRRSGPAFTLERERLARLRVDDGARPSSTASCRSRSCPGTARPTTGAWSRPDPLARRRSPATTRTSGSRPTPSPTPSSAGAAMTRSTLTLSVMAENLAPPPGRRAHAVPPRRDRSHRRALRRDAQGDRRRRRHLERARRSTSPTTRCSSTPRGAGSRASTR